MKVLITGAGGFCGRQLSRYLTSHNVEVHSAGRAPDRGAHHQIDLADVASLVNLLAAIRPEYVLHLAGTSRAERIDGFYFVNTLFAARLLSAMELAGCGGVPTLLIGTAAEYGAVREGDVPISEATPPRPVDHYGSSKLAQTLLGQAVGRTGRPIVVVRPFNIIGRGMPEHLSVQSFAKQIADGSRRGNRIVTSVGNLTTTRDFVDVETAVAVYWRLLQTSAAYGEVVNVCSGRPVVMADVLDKLITLSGCRVDVQQVPDRVKTADVPVSYGSPAKLHRMIGEVHWRDLDVVLGEMLQEELAKL